jgi:hypothetical protein
MFQQAATVFQPLWHVYLPGMVSARAVPVIKRSANTMCYACWLSSYLVFQSLEIAANNNQGSIIMFINPCEIMQGPTFLLPIKYTNPNSIPRRNVEMKAPTKNFISLLKITQIICISPNIIAEISN